MIREAMALSGVSQTQLAETLGYKRQSSIANLFAQSSLRVANMVKLLDAIGYDVIVKGRETVKAPGGQEYVPEWTITAESDADESMVKEEDI